MCVKGLTRRELGTAVGASAQISPHGCYNLLRLSSMHPFGLSPTPERQTTPFIPKGSEDLARRDCESTSWLPLKESHGMWLSLSLEVHWKGLFCSKLVRCFGLSADLGVVDMFSILEINGAKGICRALHCVLLGRPLFISIALSGWEGPGII